MQVLLDRIQFHSDQKAFKQFYQNFFFKLYQFSYFYVSSKESAEELVNDVMLGLWKKRSTLNTISNIEVYLYVAVKNASFNYLRSQKRLVPLSMDDLNVDHFYFATNPELTLINSELRMQLHEAIDQLPPRCKIIFKLIKEDGLSYKDVASILGISPKTVDSQLCLALKKLASLLQPIYY